MCTGRDETLADPAAAMGLKYFMAPHKFSMAVTLENFKVCALTHLLYPSHCTLDPPIHHVSNDPTSSSRLVTLSWKHAHCRQHSEHGGDDE
jgi:hypothetical protein